MYSYDRRYASLYRRLFVSMSMEDAKAVLGFPPGSNPTPSEVNKAYRSKALQNHPDRGGDPKKMVEVNVAKEILEGKRQFDRTPFGEPERDPRKVQQDLSVINSESKNTLDAVERALQETDITRGRLNLPSFLTHTYGQDLDRIHEDIEANFTKTQDWVKAKALVHTLTGMSVRLASRSAALSKKHGEAYAALIGMGGEALTWKQVAALHVETAKFIAAFEEFAVESGQLSKLISMSELIPVSWDELHHSSHQIVVAFKNDFIRFSNHALKAFEGTLKRAIQTVTGILLSYGDSPEHFPDWEEWRIPGDFMKVEVIVRAKMD